MPERKKKTKTIKVELKKEDVVSGPMGTLKEMEGMGMEMETNIPTKIGTNIPTKIGTHKNLEVNGLMPDPIDGIFSREKFLGSRDWNLESLKIECHLTTCVINYNNKCTMPSLIKISKTGKCIGNHPRKKKKNDRRTIQNK